MVFTVLLALLTPLLVTGVACVLRQANYRPAMAHVHQAADSDALSAQQQALVVSDMAEE